MELGRARDLKDKTVLISGGASGVGFECARLFTDLGARAVIIGRNEKKLSDACEILNHSSECAYYFTGNVSDPSFADKAFAFAATQTGGDVDILINNAGTILRKNAADTSDDEWRDLMSVNLDGVFYCSRAAANHMKGEGAIVNVSSTCGQVGASGLAAYCASKGAVDQLTRTMALELAPRNITVNAVAPGAINSPMLYSNHGEGVTDSSVVEGNLRSIPIGAVAEPREVARAIKFLCMERHITGTILSVDGGYTAQ